MSHTQASHNIRNSSRCIFRDYASNCRIDPFLFELRFKRRKKDGRFINKSFLKSSGPALAQPWLICTRGPRHDGNVVTFNGSSFFPLSFFPHLRLTFCPPLWGTWNVNPPKNKCKILPSLFYTCAVLSFHTIPFAALLLFILLIIVLCFFFWFFFCGL